MDTGRDAAGSRLPTTAVPAMGTVVSVHPGVGPEPSAGAGGSAQDDAADRAAVAAVASVFARWEALCSLFDAGSELSRVGRGQLALTEASEEVRDAYALAIDWRTITGGAFTPHRGDGVIDLNGVVKALAAEEAGEALDGLGHREWVLDAGGDVLVAAGVRLPVGIVDPAERTQLIAGFDLDGGDRRAVATSGGAERGEHIWTVAGLPRSPFVQVSVAARELVTADVLATAIVAGGFESLDALAGRFDIDVLAVTRDGGLVATPGWPRTHPD